MDYIISGLYKHHYYLLILVVRKLIWVFMLHEWLLKSCVLLRWGGLLYFQSDLTYSFHLADDTSHSTDGHRIFWRFGGGLFWFRPVRNHLATQHKSLPTAMHHNKKLEHLSNGKASRTFPWISSTQSRIRIRQRKIYHTFMTYLLFFIL